jgi:hypothetical protein
LGWSNLRIGDLVASMSLTLIWLGFNNMKRYRSCFIVLERTPLFGLVESITPSVNPTHPLPGSSLHFFEVHYMFENSLIFLEGHLFFESFTSFLGSYTLFRSHTQFRIFSQFWTSSFKNKLYKISKNIYKIWILVFWIFLFF